MAEGNVIWLDVLKFTRTFGEDKIPMDYYEILPEEDELVDARLWKLYQEGIKFCSFIGVEIHNARVRGNEYVYFPALGSKYHISRLILEHRLCKIDGQDFIDIKEYLER